jgi:CDP-diacylglycerol--glycerol-3-phosphate 3-phosphatidyltransferase
MGALLASLWSLDHALHWLLLSSAASVYFLAFLHRRLSLNRSTSEGSLLTGFGPGTSLSIIRAALLAWSVGFLFSSRPSGLVAWLPAVMYTTSAIADYFDGYLARVSNHATLLGQELDLELDAFGILTAVSLALWNGALPLWFLPIGLARYGFTAGLWLRSRLQLSNHPLPPSVSRRPIAGLTMGFLSVMLWPIVSPPATTLAGIVFLLPFAASFSRDWMVVSGMIDASSSKYLRLRQSFRKVALNWGAFGSRAIVVLSLGAASFRFLTDPDQWVSAQPFQPAIALIFAMVSLLSLASIALGAMGRTAAILGLFPVGFTTIAAGLNIERGTALTGLLLVLILGTGKWSLWKPEDRWFQRRAGE